MPEDPAIAPVGGPSSQDADVRHGASALSILRLASETLARLAVIARACVGRERSRQQSFREQNGLPKSAKLPYEPQPLTEVEQVSMDISLSVLSALFGPQIASYASGRLCHAIDTGDLRSFKIRILFLKIRDSLKGFPIYRQFLDGLEDAISDSENMAGCTPDSSPRRLSKWEQARKLRIQERIVAQNKIQLELPLQWPEGNTSDDTGHDNTCEQVINKGSSDRERDVSKEANLQYIENGLSGLDRDSKNNSPKHGDNGAEKEDKFFTVKSDTEGKFYSKNSKPRKARNYETVEQILDDIESGVIARYESTDEIKADLKSGLITPVEALMFASALDRYSQEDQEGEADDMSDEELEREIGEACDAEDDDVADDEDLDDDDFTEEESRPRHGGGTPFSYNPRGFAGVGGRISASGDWNRDDAW